MRRLLLLGALTALVACSAPALGATLPVNQRFVDSKGKVSLLTRSGGKGFLTGRTRCGRFRDQRVSLTGGRVRSRKGARIRVTGTIPSSRMVQIRATRGRCAVSLTLRRNSRPE